MNFILETNFLYLSCKYHEILSLILQVRQDFSVCLAGVTTVLTMAFLTIDNRRDLPEVSYSTALDYFLGTCFSMVLATILQFASNAIESIGYAK